MSQTRSGLFTHAERYRPQMGSVILGAVLAAIFALVGTAYSQDRDYKQWLRAERLKASTQLLASAGAEFLRIRVLLGEVAHTVSREPDALASINAVFSAQSELEILGPEELVAAAHA